MERNKSLEKAARIHGHMYYGLLMLASGTTSPIDEPVEVPVMGAGAAMLLLQGFSEVLPKC